MVYVCLLVVLLQLFSSTQSFVTLFTSILLLNTDKRKMLHKFFQAMLENPTKDDWTELVLQDLLDFGIMADLQALGAMAKSTFKKLKEKNLPLTD